MKKKIVGIIGCGVIGTALAKVLVREFRNQAELRYLYDLHADKVNQVLKRLPQTVHLTDFKTLIQKSDLIIECASPSVAPLIAYEGLKRHKQVIILSTGGLIQSDHFLSLLNKSKGKLWVPTGAIAGIDGLLAARESGLKSVVLRIRKPPQGLKGAPFFKGKPFPKLKKKEEKLLFSGNALSAIRAFPKNVNVSAVLSLAGIGPRRTRVEVWTSETYSANQHEVEIAANSGTLKLMIKNVPSKLNPKTSALAIYSVIALLRKYFSPFKIGT